ncbi:MAG: UDP-N-acetylmuramate dehydrogenase [Pseudomonadota bacterium]|nr:UDP-N-acetylmuramate dehydrogenase [Pseudomonadota bacterium]
MQNNLTRSSLIKFNYPLGKKTWFGSGGNCTFFIKVNSSKDLNLVLKYIPRFLPTFIVGNGSNILIRDGGFKGLVIKLGNEFKQIKFDKKSSILTVGSAAKDLEVSNFCLNNNITGFEFLSGIPGTIGGNLKMNAGCFGHEISEKLLDCTIIDRKLNIKKFCKKDIDFGYRKTSFKKDHIILSARFRLENSSKKNIAKKILNISKTRKRTQPVSSRTGGSTFTNPTSEDAWKLIDGVNFRGKEIGGAKVSNMHSNFLINENSATSLDIEILAEEIRRKVWNKFRIKLNWELMRIGEFKRI